MDKGYFSIWKERLNNNLKKELGNRTALKIDRSIKQQCGHQAKNEKQWLKTCLDTMEASLSKEELKNVMKSCGRLCLMPSITSYLLKVKNTTQSHAEFVDTVNKEVFGEGHLRIENNTIYGKHDSCYCSLVQSFDIEYPEFYCDCRLGWLDELYSKVFGAKVHTEITASIIRGDSYCEYKIEY